MAWVAAINGYDTGGPGATLLLFAMGAGIAFTDRAYAPSGFLSWKSSNQKVDTATAKSNTGSILAAGGITIAADLGELIIENLPSDISQPGPWDVLATWAWARRRADLYWVPGTLWSARQLVDSATMSQPVATIVANGTPGSTLVWPLADPRAVLDAPLQPTKYGGVNAVNLAVDGGLDELAIDSAGTESLGVYTSSGILEGGADILGLPKPILYGICSNIPPVRVDAATLVYQIADVAVTILCVRDGGLGLNAGTIRATVASFTAGIPAPGTYDIYAGVDGTFIKLGTTPVFKIAVDAYEGAPSPLARSHAQIWERFRTQRCGNVLANIDHGTVNAVDALDNNEVGFWWGAETTQLAAMNEILVSLSGYEVQGFDYLWRLYKLVRPAGATVADFALLKPFTQFTAKNRAIRGLTLVRPGFAPDGLPPYLVNVCWGRNYQIFSEADFAGAAPQRLRDKFKLEYRTAPAQNNAIWDPVAQTGPWIDAPILTVNTGYQPGADGLTCPQAVTEATRLLALYTATTQQFQLDFTPEVTDQIEVGDVCSITYPQVGLGSGPLFLVLQSYLQISVTDQVPRMSLVLGFQT